MCLYVRTHIQTHIQTYIQTHRHTETDSQTEKQRLHCRLTLYVPPFAERHDLVGSPPQLAEILGVFQRPNLVISTTSARIFPRNWPGAWALAALGIWRLLLSLSAQCRGLVPIDLSN